MSAHVDSLVQNQPKAKGTTHKLDFGTQITLFEDPKVVIAPQEEQGLTRYITPKMDLFEDDPNW